MLPFTASTKGQLLIATPPLIDPNFDRSVVLVLEHNADGALGLVLNRPEQASYEGLVGWLSRCSPPQQLFMGGPVETDGYIGLARVAGGVETDGWTTVLDDLGTVDLSREPDEVPDVLNLRIFRGYSGWGAGQLDAEIAEGAWIVVPRADDDPFAARPGGLWREVLRRQGGRLAWLAAAPDDLSTN